MKTKQKYLHVKIEGQSEIGVIDLGKIKHFDMPESDYKKIIEPKLIEMLKEHFDYNVKIRTLSSFRSTMPIQMEYIVVIESDENDYAETVLLEETWMY